MSPRILTLLCALPLLLLVGCESDAADDAGVFESMLMSVPDEENFRGSVGMADLARLRAVAGIEAPADIEGERAHFGAIQEWRRDREIPLGIGSGAYWDWFLGISENNNVPAASERTSTTLGFGFGDVDGFLTAGRPPNQFFMITGAFNPGAVEPALGACDDCPAPETSEVDDVTIYSWGDGLRQSLEGRLGPPIFDTLGRGGYLAVMQDRVIRSFEHALTAAAIEGATGGGSSLASDEDWRETVEYLDGLGLLSVDLSDRVTTVAHRERVPDVADPAAVEEAFATDGRLPLLDSYALLAVAQGMRDGVPFTMFVLPFEDAETAETNVERLRTRFQETPITVSEIGASSWTEMFDTVEVEAQGRLLVATATGRAVSAVPFQWEPLFLIDPAAE